MEAVDEARAKYGLKSLGELRAAGALKDILTQQKEETVDALSVVARPVDVRYALCFALLRMRMGTSRVCTY